MSAIDNLVSFWDRKEIWRRRGRECCVEISRHYVTTLSEDDHRGPHRWAVYAYIYPPHSLFGGFLNGTDIFQPAARAMPLHCGPSFLQWHYAADGSVTSIQVGADYNHLGDEIFSISETPSDALQVFLDADRLFRYLHDEHKDAPT